MGEFITKYKMLGFHAITVETFGKGEMILAARAGELYNVFTPNGKISNNENKYLLFEECKYFYAPIFTDKAILLVMSDEEQSKDKLRSTNPLYRIAKNIWLIHNEKYHKVYNYEMWEDELLQVYYEEHLNTNRVVVIDINSGEITMTK